MSRNNVNRSLLQLVHYSLKLYKNFNLAETLEVQSQKSNILSILNHIDFKQFHLDSQEEYITQGLGICSIYEQYPLRISMYYIPAGQTMKLHDHPGMEVISYLFKGKMEARLFTQVKDDLYKKKTLNLQKGSVSYIDGYKGNQQNLHQFYAIQSSYFLDIIFPDYDENRPCRFFEQVEAIDENTFRLKQILNYDVPFTLLNQ